MYLADLWAISVNLQYLYIESFQFEQAFVFVSKRVLHCYDRGGLFQEASLLSELNNFVVCDLQHFFVRQSPEC